LKVATFELNRTKHFQALADTRCFDRRLLDQTV
jgi:hypothetical protein